MTAHQGIGKKNALSYVMRKQALFILLLMSLGFWFLFFFFFKPNPIVYILAPGSYESGSPIFKSGESLTVMTLFFLKYLKLA